MPRATEQLHDVEYSSVPAGGRGQEDLMKRRPDGALENDVLKVLWAADKTLGALDPLLRSTRAKA